MPDRNVHAPSRRAAGTAAWVAFCVLAGTNAAASEKLTAIVQSIDAPSLTVQAFDVLAAGTKLQLQPGETIELGYFESCVVERISGGSIVVNETESWVVDGTLDRQKTDCANGGAKMQAAEMDAAVFVVRDAAAGMIRTVSDAQPLLVAPGIAGAQSARIERLDAPAAAIFVELKDGIADLAATGHRLSAGGEYAITAGQRSARFKVADAPAKTDGAALSRLILF